MKLRGIVRKIDHLGRLVLPKEIRKSYFIDTGDPVEIIPLDEGILLRKHDTIDNFSLHMDFLDTLIEENTKDFGEAKVSEIRKMIQDIKNTIEN